jgi:2'-5' RNA ligase
MIDDHIPRRAFLGISTGGRFSQELARSQRALYAASRSEGREVSSIPRRVLALPLVDLGSPYLEAMEAAQLAADRILRSRAPIQVQLGHFESWPSDDNPQLIILTINDETGALTQFRQDLAASAKAFGFPVQEGEFSPHIPLIRVVGDGPPIPLDGMGIEGELTIDTLTAFAQQESFGKFQIRSLWSRPFSQATPFTNLHTDKDAMDTLRAQLDARLQNRKSNFRSRRVSVSAADITTALAGEDGGVENSSPPPVQTP